MTDHRREYYWRIDGVTDDITNMPLDGHVGPETTRRYGESYSTTLRLSPESDSPTGNWQYHQERYDRLLRYGVHAGQFALHTLVTGKVAYTETHTGESLLVSLTPPVDADASRGGYYLVSSFEDATTMPAHVCLLDVELTYLASLDEYSTLEGVRSVLEADGI